ncbi:MAG: hypothetical protein AB7U18_21530, partial [Dehalococcoidia bacterium]
MTRLKTGDTDGTTRRPQPFPAPASRLAISWQTCALSLGLALLLTFLALTPLPPFASDVYGSLVRRYVVIGAVLLGYLGWLLVQRRLP